MCVYVYTQIYIYMYSVNVLFKLTCFFLYCVFVKDIQIIIFKCHEIVLRLGRSLFPMKAVHAVAEDHFLVIFAS